MSKKTFIYLLSTLYGENEQNECEIQPRHLYPWSQIPEGLPDFPKPAV